MKQFFSVHDIPNLKQAVDTALHYAKNPFADEEKGKRKTIGLLFFNPSLRTRMSTQKAAANLGMNCMVLNTGQDAWTLETRDGIIMNGAAGEHIREAAAVLGQYCDILGVRSFPGLQNREEDYSEHIFRSIQKYSGRPIISLETATRHPLQSFADLITIEQFKQNSKPKIVLTWAPHPKALPQAVPNSFAEWMKRAVNELGYSFTIACPEGYELSEEFTSGCTITHNQDEALENADFVYAKNWSSFQDYGKILSMDTAWMITSQKMSLTNNGKFMHCLPVRRNQIVADHVLDSDQSIVIPEAGNRVYSAQTILSSMLEAL
jgi:N-succinyl-L-ornithine transcarbamylase